MRPNIRSASGAILMLAIIPIFAGLLACMPVPIGNPEKSRIDPEISGVWLVADDSSFEGVYMYQPWDKRTWLVVGVPIQSGPEFAGEPLSIHSAEDAIAALREQKIGDDGITASAAVLYKAWLTKLGGKVFMTWEPTGGVRDDGSHVPEYWFVWRVEKEASGKLEFFIVNPEHDAFEGALEATEAFLEKNEAEDAQEYLRQLNKMRPKWERALRKVAKNIDDEELYGEPLTFHKLPDELYFEAAELIQEVIESGD
mgnify:FL=1